MLRRASVLVCLALALGACSSGLDDGFAVALTIMFDASVTSQALAEVSHITLAVPEDGYTTDIAPGRAFARTERVFYRPKVGDSAVTFTLTAEAAGSVVVGITPASKVGLVAGKTSELTVVLYAPSALPDMGNDAGHDAGVDGISHDSGTDGSIPAKPISFITTPLVAVAHGPVGVGIADFNGDKLNDIVVASSSGKIEVFFGKANHATPTTPDVTFTGVPAPGALAVADVTSDGIPDLIVPDRSTNKLHFLINDGTGNFTAKPNPSTTVSAPDSITVADFDNDGHADDVAVASSGNSGITVCIDSGGTCTSTITLSSAAPIQHVRSADFDENGYADIVSTPPSTGHVAVNMNPYQYADADAGEPQPLTNATVPVPHDVLLWDYLGNDGRTDLFILGDNNDGPTGALLQNVSGALTQKYSQSPGQNISVAPLGYHLSTALALDLDGKGLPSFVSTQYDGVLGSNSDNSTDANYIIVGTGTTGSIDDIVTTMTAYASGAQPDNFVAGDLDGDGLVDIVVINRADDTIGIMRQLTGKTFYAAPVPWPSVYIYDGGFKTGDVNGDGYPDLVGGGSLVFAINDGFGNFSSHNLNIDSNNSNFAGAPAVFDANEDGAPDIVFGTRAGGAPNPSALGVVFANGVGNFSSPATPVYTSNYGALDFMDTQGAKLDGDTHTDLLLLASPSSGDAAKQNVTYLHGNGQGGFTYIGPYSVPGAIAMSIADIDQDGVLDVLVLSAAPPQLTWLHNTGTSFTVVPPMSTMVSNATGFSVFDANGDGKLDVAVSGDSLRLFYGDGKGNFGMSTTLYAAAPTGGVASAFLSGGALPDIVASAGSLVHVFKWEPGNTYSDVADFAAGAYLATSDQPENLIAADFNGDKRSDLLVFGSMSALLRNDSP